MRKLWNLLLRPMIWMLRTAQSGRCRMMQSIFAKWHFADHLNFSREMPLLRSLLRTRNSGRHRTAPRRAGTRPFYQSLSVGHELRGDGRVLCGIVFGFRFLVPCALLLKQWSCKSINKCINIGQPTSTLKCTDRCIRNQIKEFLQLNSFWGFWCQWNPAWLLFEEECLGVCSLLYHS